MNVVKNITIEMKDADVKRPKRSTIDSAGHDIFAGEDVTIFPGETSVVSVPFYFKENFDQADFKVRIYVRSSFGIKKKVRLYEDERIDFVEIDPFKTNNQITVYNDSNETVTINKNEHFAQFIITNENNELISDFLIEDVSNSEKEKHKHIVNSAIVKTESASKYVLKEEIILEPNEQRLLATGLKSKIPNGTYLGIHITEEAKQFIYLANGVGVADADYYNNASNEGHLFFAIVNNTNEKLTLKRDSHIIDLIVKKYYTLEGEKIVNNVRTGGLGSTTKKEEKK